MARKEFVEYFGIPYRTIQDWELENRKCPEYLIDLMEYKLIKEDLIRKDMKGE
jgi:DNA-binding transcriptional regulator YiaG